MKLIIIIIAFIFSFNYSNANYFEWARSSGTYNHDIVNSIALDPAGYIYIGGEFAGTMVFSEDISLTSTHPSIADLYIAKYDEQGNVHWAIQGVDKFYDSIKRIVVDNNGDLIIYGEFIDTLKIGGTTIYSSQHAQFLAKLNQSNEIEWIHKILGMEISVLFFLDVDSNNNIYYCSSSWSGMRINDQHFPNNCCGASHIFQFNSDGDILNHKKIESVPWRTWPAFIQFDSNNNIYLASTAISQINLNNFEVIGSNHMGLILKMDQDFNEVWIRLIDGIHTETIDCFIIDDDDKLVISGYAQSGMVDFGGEFISDSRYLAKYDTDNNLIWLKTTSHQYSDLLIDRNGNYVFKRGNQFDTYTKHGDYLNSFSLPINVQHSVKQCNDVYYFAGVFAGTLNFSDSVSVVSRGLNDVYLTKYRRSSTINSPIVTYPCESTNIVYKDVQFEWVGSPCNYKSQIIVSRDENFTDIVIDSTLLGSRFTFDLEKDHVFFVKVRFIDLPYMSEWSESCSFYVNNDDIKYILLAQGWNFISSYIETEDMSMEAVFEEIEDDIVIVKMGSGIYIPANDLNTLGDWNITKAYNVFASSATTLVMQGTAVVPEDTDITLSTGWNAVPYLRQESMDITTALADIESKLVIVKNRSGQIWIPGSINTIQTMYPGEGYSIFMTEGAVLNYPEN